MSRAGARQIHCEAAIPCDKFNNAVLQYECLATLWHIGDLRPRCGVVSSDFPALGGVLMAGKSHATATRFFKSRLSHLPERWITVIVRHRIVKPRLDDELAAVEDARHRHRFLHRLSVQLANLVSSRFIL